jgi:hypothetical protein
MPIPLLFGDQPPSKPHFRAADRVTTRLYRSGSDVGTFGTARLNLLDRRNRRENVLEVTMLAWLSGKAAGDDYEAHPIPLSRQKEKKIVEELRSSHLQRLKEKKHRKIGGGAKVLPVVGVRRAASEAGRWSRESSLNESTEYNDANHHNGNGGVGGPDCDERNLKLALTHPTIAKFLKEFMIAQGCGDLLDFYLDIVEIRTAHRRRQHQEAVGMWVAMAKVRT